MLEYWPFPETMKSILAGMDFYEYFLKQIGQRSSAFFLNFSKIPLKIFALDTGQANWSSLPNILPCSHTILEKERNWFKGQHHYIKEEHHHCF